MPRPSGLGAALCAILLFVGCIVCGPSKALDASPADALLAVTDQMTYNAGDAVSLRFVSPSPIDGHALDSYVFTIRFEGDPNPVADRLKLKNPKAGSYALLWTIPTGARAGRYEIGLRAQDANSQEAAQENPQLCSFVVHRQVLRIDSISIGQGSGNANQSYYTSGDSIGCGVHVTNLSAQALTGLRVEFSERYWPWIAQQTQNVGSNISTLKEDVTLKPHSGWQTASEHCVEAPKVEKPSIKQYAAVVWDHDRRQVYAVGFSPVVFIDPPGVTTPKPYGGQYVYPSLEAFNTKGYRLFHPEPFGASAIQFETHHTMLAAGGEASVKFAINNPSGSVWPQANVRARLLGPDGKELTSKVVVESISLEPRGAKLTQEVRFELPPALSGLFHVWVEIADPSGRLIATNVLELGVNPLPQSVLIFCAHEDDDTTQMGFIRALVENQVPLRVIYFTSGDAGACDRYFQHTCGPAEALNYGGVRMQESRAALGHLGVTAENIIFLGLPDGGSGKIWYEHQHASDPYLAVLLASDHTPYEPIFRPNLPYARDAVVETVEEIVKKYQPDVVFTVHPPAEGHIDHIVNNYFVVKALQGLVRAGSISPDLEVRVDRIFDPREHPATPYHYEDHEFYVSGNAAALAQEAGWYYQSQGSESGAGNLRTWDQLRRTQGYRKVLDWKDHQGWNEKE